MSNHKEITIDHKGITEKYKINKFDLDQMIYHPHILMIAKRDSGKSWIVRSILQHFSKKVPVGIIISPTDRIRRFYSDFIPDSYIYYEFKPDTIERMLERQKLMIKKQMERKKAGKETNTRAFIVMDDCLSSKEELTKYPAVSELLFNGRFHNIMYILIIQFPSLQK